MNIKSIFSFIQSFILIGTILYIVFPDFYIGPIDDTVIAVVAGIAELAFDLAKSRGPRLVPGRVEGY